MKWKAMKWIMASLHSHPSQVAAVCVCVGGVMTLIHSSRRDTLPKVSGIGVVKPKPHIREAAWLFWKVCVHIWQAEWLYFLLCFASRLRSTNKNDHRQSLSIKGRGFNCWQPSCWWWSRASERVIQGYIRLQGHAHIDLAKQVTPAFIQENYIQVWGLLGNNYN